MRRPARRSASASSSGSAPATAPARLSDSASIAATPTPLSPVSASAPPAAAARQPVELAQAPALGEQRLFFFDARPDCVDLAELEVEQVEVAIARARALAQRLELAGQLAHACVRRRERRRARRAARPAEAVEQLELGARHRELAVLVLSEERHQRAPQLAEVGGRRRAALDEGAGAPLGADAPRQDHSRRDRRSARAGPRARGARAAPAAARRRPRHTPPWRPAGRSRRAPCRPAAGRARGPARSSRPRSPR